MPNQPKTIRNIKITCKTCRKSIVWPIDNWDLNIVGLIQLRCRTCGQVISFPNDAVWGLAEKTNIENTTARLLFDWDNPDKGTKTDRDKS